MGVPGGSASRLAPAAATALLGAAAGSLAVLAVLAGAAPAAGAPAPVVAPAPAPAFAADAPDPDVLRAGSTYFAYTTGTTWGNHIGVLESSQPSGGFHTVNGRTWGSTALGPLPSWEEPDTQNAPGVIYWAGRYVMFYDARGLASGEYCISVATSSSPTGPFLDNSSGPVICQTSLGGSIDPDPFVDASGQPWLYWKSNGGSSSSPAHLWGAPLTADGLSIGAGPIDLVDQDTTAHPWQATIENPSMLYSGGSYYLFFAGGNWQSAGYAEGYAVCAGPGGPCGQPQAGPILSSYAAVAGPAAGNAFPDASGNLWLSYAAWTAGCTSYTCGGARELYVAPLGLGGSAPAAGTASTGSTGAIGSGAAVPAAACRTASGPMEAQARPVGSGYWVTDAAGDVTACGSVPNLGGLTGVRLVRPVVGIAATPDGRGYWLVASDGGVFTFGDAGFHGSAGAIRLARPIVGMASTPDGQGYWLVASDGGVFTYGDAGFYGSTGGIRLPEPIAGISPTADGRGYRLLTADGSAYRFGDA